jgi:hypothetical protein
MGTRSREFWRDHGLLIGGSALLWALVLLGGWAGYRYLWGRYELLWPLLPGVERPRELDDAGVVHGRSAVRSDPGPGDPAGALDSLLAARRG